MKIAINGERLIVPEFAGPEIYTLNIIKGLGKVDKNNSYTIFLSGSAPDWVMTELKDLPSNFKLIITPKFISWTQVNLAYNLWIKKYDVLFSAVHTIPLLAITKTRIVSMLHGLEYKSNKEKVLFPKNLLTGKPEWLTCRFSHKLIAPSEATKQAIIGTGWKLGNPNISVVPEGVSEKFKKGSVEDNIKALEKYKIPNKPYLIFVSTIQPRKNLKAIVEALSILKKSFAKEINLVVCGKFGWNYEEEVKSPEKFGVSDQVFFAGRVPDEDLIALLSGAKAYISTSFEEGFGLPLLEAMACEIPAIVSDIPSHKNLAEDLAIYVDPYKTKDIAVKMNEFLEEDEAITRTRVKEAKSKAGEYTWEKSAQSLLDILSQTNTVEK